MPEIMVEAFAKGLIDKIMLEAFDTMDPNDEKLRMLGGREESANVQSQPTRTTLQIHDRSCVDRNESETTELIENMVCGLRNLKIGDSTSVPSLLSNLEKQVKHVVCNIDSISTPEPTRTAGMAVTQGQGDVHQIIHNAVIETPTDPLPCTHKEKKTYDSSEIVRVSVNVLHRMIEELETKTDENPETEDEIDSICKEGIAAWEETQERFIRTIESIDDYDRNNIGYPSSESSSKNIPCDEGLTSSSMVHSTSLASNVCLEEVAIEEITPSPLPGEKVSSKIASKGNKSCCTDVELQNQKRKTVFGRIRKMMRAVFGRRKN